VRHHLVLALILLAALALRGLYLQEIAGGTEFSHPSADAAFHDYWARGLVSGDWPPPTDNPNPYIESVPFIRPPGYPYFLALAYALTGGSYLGARIIQMLLGVLNCWLAYLLGRAVFNRTVGLVAAAMMAASWALIYFEGELHAPVLLITLSLLFFLSIAAWLRRPAPWRLLVAGAILGLLALVRANLLVFAPVAAVWVWSRARRAAGGPAALKPVVALGLGTLLAIAPATIRNVVVAGEFVPISTNGAINLYIGNNESADGATTRIPDVREFTGQSGWSCFGYDRIVQGVSEQEGRPLSYSQVERYFWRRGLDYIVHHPGRFLQLTARRAALFWGPAEVSNNRAIGFEKRASGVLRWLPGFPLILALALLGAGVLLLELRRKPDATGTPVAMAPRSGPLAALAALYVATTFVSFLPFLVAGRFRVPVIPFLLLFGAYGLHRLGRMIGARAWSPALKLGAAGVVLYLVAGHPLAAYQSDRCWWLTDRAMALARAGDAAAAEQEFQLALRENPGFIDARLGLANLLASLGRYDEAMTNFRHVAAHRPDVLEARIGLAASLNLTGRAQEAIGELRAVLARSPNSAQARFELGRALVQVGQYDAAAKELRESLRLQPGVALAHVCLGMSLARQEHQREAIAEFRQALLIDPQNAEACRELGGSLCAVDSVAAGVRAYEQALELAPRNPAPALELGHFFFATGRMEAAETWYRKAVAIAPRNAVARAKLASALGNLGRLEEAEAEFAAAARLEPRSTEFRQRLAQVRALRSQSQH
jgi:Flp pilus assembly protein TadD